MEYVPDNYDMYVRHEAEEVREMERLPVCADCDQPITDDHLYDINGSYICPNCMESGYRRWTEDCIE